MLELESLTDSNNERKHLLIDDFIYYITNKAYNKAVFGSTIS